MDKQLPEMERGRGRSGEEGAASKEEGHGALTTSDCWARGENVCVCRRGSVPAGAIWLLDRALLINMEVNCCGST